MRLIINYFRQFLAIRRTSHRLQCVTIVCDRVEAPISRTVMRQCCGLSCSGHLDWGRHHLCSDSCCSRSEYYTREERHGVFNFDILKF